MVTTNARYPAEFRDQMVALVRGAPAIDRWVRQAGRIGYPGGTMLKDDERDGLRRLREESKQLRLERHGLSRGEPSATDGWRAMASDVTDVPTWAGLLTLGVVLDAFFRRIVGWPMLADLRARLVVDAMNMALTQWRPMNVIRHSDQGSP